MLASFLPEDVAKYFPKEHWDPDGMYASWRVTLSPIAYNTSQVKAGEAPKGFNDLLDPKWMGKIVKAHPGYSGTIMTATYQMQRDLGWTFFEQLAKQNIMQVQSSADPPKKLDLGERAAHGIALERDVRERSRARGIGHHRELLPRRRGEARRQPDVEREDVRPLLAADPNGILESRRDDEQRRLAAPL